MTSQAVDHAPHAPRAWRSAPPASPLHLVPEPGEPPFYEQLDGEQRRWLRERGTVRTYPRDAAIFHARELSGSVVVVLSGRVKLVRIAACREVLLEVCGPGELLGDLSALEGEPHGATALAVERVEALVLPASSFRWFLAEWPGAALLIVRKLQRSLADSQQKRVEFATQDTLGRLSTLLLELAQRFGVPGPTGIRIALPLSQEELAGWVGASHKSLTTALQSLRELGWVETGRRSIVLRDLEALRCRCS